jgi:hypothetical protein
VVLLLAAGCGSRTRNVTGARLPMSVEGTWVGTLSGALSGDAVLEIRGSFQAVIGDFVRRDASGPVHVAVTGHVDPEDSLHLVVGDGTLVGGTTADSLHAILVANGLVAHYDARWVPQGGVPATQSTLYPVTATGAVQAADLLWLATTEPAYARARDGALLDAVHVESPPGTAWASSALAWDGTRLWGEHAHGDGTSDLLGFDEHGRTADSIHVAYAPAALAWDGTRLWALRLDPPALLRIAPDGTTLDSLHVEVPDVRAMTWYAGRFWLTGALLRRLYRLDADGRVAFVYALPGNGVPQPVALTAYASTLEYVESVSGTTWVHRLEIAPAIP